MALKTLQSDHAEPAPAGAGRPFGALQGQAGQGADRGQDRAGGRNNNGRITVRFRGGGHKQTYRMVDFKRRKFDVPATVERLEYDPNRTALHRAGQVRRRRARLHPGAAAPRASATRWSSGEQVDVKPGNAMPLANMPVGTIVHNIEMKLGKGGQIARSAGTYAQIVGRDAGYVILRLNSGEQRLVPRPAAWRRSARCRTRTT